MGKSGSAEKLSSLKYFCSKCALYAMISASVSEGLWGVSDKSGGLVTYSQHTVLLNETARQAQAVAAGVDDGWEVI